MMKVFIRLLRQMLTLLCISFTASALLACNPGPESNQIAKVNVDSIISSPLGDNEYYVVVDTAEERDGPRLEGRVVNRIYSGQRLSVYEVKGEWARVTDPYNAEDALWIEIISLGKTKPALKPQVPELNDPRIESLPNVGYLGMTEKEIRIIQAGALHFLNNGQCSKVLDGSRSTQQAGKYFIMCGNPSHNIFFTEDDVL